MSALAKVPLMSSAEETNAPQEEYRVLALKYRPQVFDDVVGQSAVVRQLQGEIRDNRVGHAYLFTGPRGVGKTSMARIWAKALNCVKGPTPKPCGKCVHCLGIAADADMDVVEVDAATYTKKEETVELLEGIDRVAFSSRYKVYIIDEVHMFSTHSFNVLLKRLEEPPSGVVFILATTNPEKIPETVISRCRRLEFDRMESSEIVTRLAEIAVKENVKFAEGERDKVLEAIALASEGGMRDAQVALDQLISLSEGEVTLESARQLLGVVESDLLYQLLAGLVERNTVNCLMLVNDLVEKGRDLQRFIKTFSMYLRDGMLLKANAPVELLKVCRANPEKLREAIGPVSMPGLLNMMQQFLDLEEKMKGAAPARFLLEFAIIKLTAIHPSFVLDAFDATKLKNARTTADAVQPMKASLERPNAPAQKSMYVDKPAPKTGNASAAMAGAVMMRASAPEPMVDIEIGDDDVVRDPAPAARVVALAPEGEALMQFKRLVDRQFPSAMSILNDAELRFSDDVTLDIVLSAKDGVMKSTFERPERQTTLRDAAREAFGRGMKTRIFVAPSAQASGISSLTVEGETDSSSAFSSEAYVQELAPPTPRRGDVAKKATSFNEALEKFPDFRHAIELVKKHLGADPVLFNGQRLN